MSNYSLFSISNESLLIEIKNSYSFLLIYRNIDKNHLICLGCPFVDIWMFSISAESNIACARLLKNDLNTQYTMKCSFGYSVLISAVCYFLFPSPYTASPKSLSVSVDETWINRKDLSNLINICAMCRVRFRRSITLLFSISYHHCSAAFQSLRPKTASSSPHVKMNLLRCSHWKM